VKMKHAKL